jgi:hypothetical protein
MVQMMTNERLQELMNQTGVPVSMPFDEWCEKFAELIVRECASVGYESSYSECALNVSNKILEHFGVQE